MADATFCETAHDGSAERKNVRMVAVDLTIDSGGRAWRDFVCVFKNGDVAVACQRRGTAWHFCGCGSDAAASGVHLISGGFVDDSSRGDDRAETQTVGGRAADRAGGCIGSGHGVISDYFAAADSGGRRAGSWVDSIAAARHG